MTDTYNEVIELLKKYPEILFGFTDIHFSEYSSKYKGALVIAVPHSQMLALDTYDEQLFEGLIAEARNKGNAILKELESILQKGDYDCKYEIPPVAQTSEETLVAPFSFKYAAVNARLGWIGKNGVLITEKYGPRVSLFAMLINFDFPAALPVINSKCPEDCFECVKACPHDALKGKQWDIHTQRSELIDYQLCNQKRRLFIKSHNRKHSCGFCMVSCPYGL